MLLFIKEKSHENVPQRVAGDCRRRRTSDSSPGLCPKLEPRLRPAPLQRSGAAILRSAASGVRAAPALPQTIAGAVCAGALLRPPGGVCAAPAAWGLPPLINSPIAGPRFLAGFAPMLVTIE